MNKEKKYTTKKKFSEKIAKISIYCSQLLVHIRVVYNESNLSA